MKTFNLLKKSKLAQRGDTIVEVMISMAVLSIVIAVAYTTSTRSFHASVDSQYRDQAVSYAQQQLELLKNADNSGSAVIGSYKVNYPFCVKPSDITTLQRTSSINNPCDIPLGGWGSSGANLFTITDTYTGDASPGTKTFVITVSWNSAESRPQQTVVYYKPNDGFVGPVVVCQAPSDSCASVSGP